MSGRAYNTQEISWSKYCKLQALSTREQWEEVPELRSSQEAPYAAEFGYRSLILIAEGTDVIALCIGMCDKIPSQRYQKCGTKAQTRLLDINKHWGDASVVLLLVCMPS